MLSNYSDACRSFLIVVLLHVKCCFIPCFFLFQSGLHALSQGHMLADVVAIIGKKQHWLIACVALLNEPSLTTYATSLRLLYT